MLHKLIIVSYFYRGKSLPNLGEIRLLTLQAFGHHKSTMTQVPPSGFARAISGEYVFYQKADVPKVPLYNHMHFFSVKYLSTPAICPKAEA